MLLKYLLTGNLILQERWSGRIIIHGTEPVIRVGDLDSIVGCHMLFSVDIDSIFLQVRFLSVHSLGVCSHSDVCMVSQSMIPEK
jgi:hypothetical protein